MNPKPPQYQQPAEDPQTLALKERAKQDEIAAGMDRARIDSASILARYGMMRTAAAAGGASAAGASPTMSSDAPGGGASGLPALLNAVLAQTRV